MVQKYQIISEDNPNCVGMILEHFLRQNRQVGYITVQAHESDEVTDLRVRQAHHILDEQRKLDGLVDLGVISREIADRDLKLTREIQRFDERYLERSVKVRIPLPSQDVYGLKK